MHHENSHHHLNFFKNKELDSLYFSVFLKTLAESLVVIFIPIYFLKNGYGFYDISLYFLIYFAVIVLAMFPGIWSIQHLGLKKTMTLGTLFYVVYFFLLEQILVLPYSFIAVIHGIGVGLYFSAYNLELSYASEKNKEGRELSMMSAIAIFTSVLGPLFGSLIIGYLSYDVVFYIAAGLILISIIPLFFTKDQKLKLEKSLNPSTILHVDTKRKAFAYQLDAIVMVISVIFWPVFIFYFVGNILSLGIILSLTSIILVFITLLVGSFADRKEIATLKCGVWISAPIWILRIFLISPFGLFFSNFLSNVGRTAIHLSFGKLVFQKAKASHQKMEYFLFRELNLGLGRITMLLFAVLVFFFFPLSNLIWMFLLASALSFGYLILVKEM